MEQDIQDSNINSIKESIRRSKETIYRYARANKWEWFLTYTFNPVKVDSFNYQECYKSLSNHMKYIRKKYCPNMKYIIVPELHKSGRYHFHALMSNIDELSKVDSGKRYQGKVVYNIDSYKLGWTTAIEIGKGQSAKTANYITKYITKELAEYTKGQHRYLCSMNLSKPIQSNVLLSADQIESLKESIKKITTSAKVVMVETPDFSNKIEYIDTKIIT